MLHTTGMDVEPNLEQLIYKNDIFLLNVIVLLIGLVLLPLIAKLLNKVTLKQEIVFIVIWTVILGSIWVFTSNSSPTDDSGMVSNASLAFARNDFKVLQEDTYFKIYSFQLGYVLYGEIAVRIASFFKSVEDNLLFLEFFNVIWLALSFVGMILINTRLFSDERIRHITFLLLVFCFQPLVSCSYLYGLIPGVVCGIWAVYFEIVWLKTGKLRCMIMSAILIGLGVLIKPNYSIFAVALGIVALISVFKTNVSAREIRNVVIYIVSVVLLVVTLPASVKSFYEKRSGVDLGDAIPYLSWFALGMSEPTYAGTGPGWYNAATTVWNFYDSDCNAKVASERSYQYIQERMAYFRDNQQYAVDFYYGKAVSQWNETTYQSVWNNNVRGQYKEKTGLAAWACSKERGRTIVEGFMDYYAQLVFFGCLVGVYSCKKRDAFYEYIFPLIILGGFLYHILAEAKSQYSLPYFILMSGFAAKGIVAFYDSFLRKRVLLYTEKAKCFFTIVFKSLHTYFNDIFLKIFRRFLEE